MSAEAAHSKVPSHAQSVSRMPHELPFRTKTLEEHHQLQLEKDDRINGGAAIACIRLLYEFSYKREVKRFLHVSIEVIVGD